MPIVLFVIALILPAGMVFATPFETEALALGSIAHPHRTAAQISSLGRLLIDNKLLRLEIVQYDETIRRHVNPEAGEFHLIAGAVGADISRTLLATRFTHAYFIDKQPVRAEALRKAIRNIALNIPFLLAKQYHLEKYFAGWSIEGTFSGNIEKYLVFELQQMGVDLQPDQVDHDHLMRACLLLLRCHDCR